MRRPAWLIAVAALVIGGACGGGSDPGITDGASQELQLRVQALHEASLSGDHVPALDTLAEIRVAVADLQTRGELDDERAARILAAAAAVEDRLPLVPVTTTTTTTTTAAPPPPPVDDDDDDRDNRGGEGRGQDKDKDDD